MLVSELLEYCNTYSPRVVLFKKNDHEPCFYKDTNCILIESHIKGYRVIHIFEIREYLISLLVEPLFEELEMNNPLPFM